MCQRGNVFCRRQAGPIMGWQLAQEIFVIHAPDLSKTTQKLKRFCAPSDVQRRRAKGI